MFDETVHTHTGAVCDPHICPNDLHCKGMQPLHYCIPTQQRDGVPQFECHHLSQETFDKNYPVLKTMKQQPRALQPNDTCPGYSISLTQMVNVEVGYVSSVFTLTTNSEADSLFRFVLIMSYRDDTGTLYSGPGPQLAVSFDPTKNNTKFEGGLFDRDKDLSKPFEAMFWGYVATANYGPCDFSDTFSYKPAEARDLGEATQTDYIEIKNHSGSEPLPTITLVFLDGANQGQETRIVIANAVAPHKSVRFNFSEEGLASRVNYFHFEWEYQGLVQRTESTTTHTGSYFVWVKASLSPDNSFFAQFVREN